MNLTDMHKYKFRDSAFVYNLWCDLKKLNELCDWMDEYGREPRVRSSECFERRFGFFLRRCRVAKKEERGFFLEYDELTRKRGYPHLLKIRDIKEEGLKKLNEFCDWLDVHEGKVPSYKSKSAYEKAFAQKLSALRCAKNGKGAAAFYSEYDDLVIERGYPNVFKKRDARENGLKQINNICDWWDESGRVPLQMAADPLERKQAGILQNLRGIKKGKRGLVYYPEWDELAAQRGYPKLLERRDRKQEGLEKISVLCDWMDTNGREPSNSLVKIVETRYYHFIRSLRYRRCGITKGVYYPEYDELVAHRGYPGLFLQERVCH